MAALPAFLKLKVDHKTVLCRDLNAYRALRDFLLNSGYSSVYETERVGEAKTAMATFACLSSLTGERLAVVLGMSAPEEVSRSEEHTSELQSQSNLVCRLLLEKKK